MAKRKYPSELNTRSIRVNIGDWRWLNSLSKSLGITVAEALHKVITGQDHKAPVSPAQIPMPVTSARSIPVTSARSIPVTSASSIPVASARRRSMPVTISFAREVKANDHRQNANGHRQAD